MELRCRGTAFGPEPVSHTYTQAGTYTATLTVSDGVHEVSDSVQITVTPTSAPGGSPPGSAPPQGGTQGETGWRPSISAPKSMNVRQAIRRGLRLKVGCEETCRARSVLRISGERVGASKQLRIGAGRSRTVVARLKANVRRNLLAAMRQAGLKRVTLTANTTVTTAGITRAFPAKVTLRR